MKKRVRSTGKSTVAILALLVMVPTFVWAVECFRDRGFRQVPPQEAVDACAGKKREMWSGSIFPSETTYPEPVEKSGAS